MIFHSYCSYSHSSVGYQYGSCDMSQATNPALLSRMSNIPLIASAFETGIIKEMSGPFGDRFFYLVKKLRYQDPEKTDVGRSQFLNVAFSFGENEETDFRAFHQYFSRLSDDDKAEKIASLLIIDTTNEFGLRIDAMAMASLCAETRQAYVVETGKNELEIKSISSAKECSEKISRSLGIQASQLRQDSSDPHYFFYLPKKMPVAKKNSAVPAVRIKQLFPLRSILGCFLFLFSLAASFISTKMNEKL